MKIRPSPSARQEQKLSPRLYQSLKILRMAAPELMELVQKNLEENPVLEIPEPAGPDTAAGARKLWQDLEAANRAGKRRRSAAPPLDSSELVSTPVTLTDHLNLQLALENLPASQMRPGLAIIASLDSRGYLRDSVEDIAAALGNPAPAVLKSLAVVQGFDPPGVGARSLPECLLIQLRQMGAGRLPQVIVKDHLAAAGKGKTREIARELNASPAQMEKAMEIIRGLNPSPGSLFDSDEPPAAIIPDVYVHPGSEGVEVLANRELLPRLRINKQYQKIAADAGASDRDTETAGYITSRIAEARKLIRDVEQRRVTMTKVARAVAAAQQNFFQRGPGALAPLSLADVAAQLDVHPSTISRAIVGKYMSTPYGVFEMRYFFSAGYRAAEGPLAATAVKKRLQELVAAEDRRRPLSDQKLTVILNQDGISISRRTVAKYREEAAIPSSRERRIGK